MILDVTPGRSRHLANARLIALFAASIVLTVACGADDDGLSTPTVATQAPTTIAPPSTGEIRDDGWVADPAFHDEYLVTQISGPEIPDSINIGISIDIDAQFGALTVQTSCNTSFGSFTLRPDGVASITIAGGSDLSCGPDEVQVRAVIDTVRLVSAWTETADGYQLTGPEGVSLTLSR